jgi:hypothetical protein
MGIQYFLLLWVATSGLYAHAADSLQPIGVEITTHLGDQQTFRENDVVSFLLTLDRDAYITAVYEDAENNLVQIIPNSKQPDNFYLASLFIPIPSHNASYSFRIQPPFGTETLWVFASDNAPVITGGTMLDNGLMQPDGSIDVIRSEIKSASGKWFGEAKVSITTSAQ